MCHRYPRIEGGETVKNCDTPQNDPCLEHWQKSKKDCVLCLKAQLEEAEDSAAQWESKYELAHKWKCHWIDRAEAAEGKDEVAAATTPAETPLGARHARRIDERELAAALEEIAELKAQVAVGSGLFRQLEAARDELAAAAQGKQDAERLVYQLTQARDAAVRLAAGRTRRAEAAETKLEKLRGTLDTQDFYELCQAYRHEPIGAEECVKRFEAIKDCLRTALEETRK